MLAASLHADVPLFMASPTSAWATAGRVVRAVAGHRDQVALGLLAADERDLVLRRGLGDEVVDAGLPGDRRRGARVVAGDHHGPDAHPAELGEALDEALLDRVLQLDQPQDAAVAPSASGVAPWSAIRSGRPRPRPAGPPRSAAIASTAPFRIEPPSVVGRRWCGSRRGTGSPPRSPPPSAAKPGSSPVPPGRAELGEALAGQLDDRAALGGSRPGSTRPGRPSTALGLGHARRGVIDDGERLP